ncbi:hypothetical protein [Klebsiella pneumoniae]|uniref:hypothetical protein n=1 Tax=Klebsiella pneumoniae TaxID=573 RepID=UPI003F7A394D
MALAIKHSWHRAGLPVTRAVAVIVVTDMRKTHRLGDTAGQHRGDGEVKGDEA